MKYLLNVEGSNEVKSCHIKCLNKKDGIDGNGTLLFNFYYYYYYYPKIGMF